MNTSNNLVKVVEKVADKTNLSPYYSTPRSQGIGGDYAQWKGGTKPQPVVSNIQSAFINAVVKATK